MGEKPSWVRLGEAITAHARPATYPLAIKFVEKGGEVPEKAREPLARMPICRAMNISRRFGWFLRLTKRSVFCPGMLLLGLVDYDEETWKNFTQQLSKEFVAPFMGISADASIKTMEKLAKLPPGSVEAMLVQPLERAAFEPDLVVVYGNPAQVNKLVTSVLWALGDEAVIHPWVSFGFDACHSLAEAHKSGKPQVIFPGWGARYRSFVADDELGFVVPKGLFESFREGLEKTTKIGLRYPTLFRYEAVEIPLEEPEAVPLRKVLGEA